VQYMVQHGVGAGKAPAGKGAPKLAEPDKFIASHTMYFLPGDRIKKITITEMRHDEAIIERIVRLGAEPPAQPAAITIGATTREMLLLDQEQERAAIALYTQIIEAADALHDGETAGLFRTILADEQGHHRVFSRMLALA